MPLVANREQALLNSLTIPAILPRLCHMGGLAMKRVTGLGGIFFRSDDPKKLAGWYEKHLGIQSNADGSGAMFEWRDAMNPEIKGMTVWSIFPRNTSYFGTGAQSAMINYRVENLDGLLELLKQEGVEIDPHREDYDYGRFAWIVDPEGNRIELWEPPKSS
jgi:predicted enzyme related to lactoylglutathione lyase